jgi:hypothetical protein
MAMHRFVEETSNTVDLFVISYIGPILVFLLVIVLMSAILKKTKVIGENIWVNIFVSLFVAGIFAAIPGVTKLLLFVIPWAVILIIAMFFVLVLSGFIGKIDSVKWIGPFFVVVLLLIVFFGAMGIYFSFVKPYLPGPSFGFGPNVDFDLLYFFGWLYSPAVSGAFWLLVFGGLVSWVLIKKS